MYWDNGIDPAEISAVNFENRVRVRTKMRIRTRYSLEIPAHLLRLVHQDVFKSKMIADLSDWQLLSRGLNHIKGSLRLSPSMSIRIGFGDNNSANML